MKPRTAEAWKMPPIAKVYEALGAIGDGRVRIEDKRRATVVSSDGSTTYEVESTAEGEISSNDNASYWQGYLGYPAIAVMIARGLCQPTPEVIRALSGVAWKELNTRYRNDYERTLAEVMRRAQANGFDADAIRSEVEAVLETVRKAAPLRGERGRPPSRAGTGARGPTGRRSRGD
jgi:hypothetical protein